MVLILFLFIAPLGPTTSYTLTPITIGIRYNNTIKAEDNNDPESVCLRLLTILLSSPSLSSVKGNINKHYFVKANYDSDVKPKITASGSSNESIEPREYFYSELEPSISFSITAGSVIPSKNFNRITPNIRNII